jgi:hypothetical protein
MLATAESKNQAVSKLESLIERGRSRAANVIDHVMRHQPTDRLVRGDALEFRAADNLPEILITVPDREQGKVDQTLHRNAIYQMAQTTEMPMKFLASLQAIAEPWGRELLAYNLQTVFNCRFQRKQYSSVHCGRKCGDSSRIPIAASIRGPWSRLSPRGGLQNTTSPGDGKLLGCHPKRSEVTFHRTANSRPREKSADACALQDVPIPSGCNQRVIKSLRAGRKVPVHRQYR